MIRYCYIAQLEIGDYDFETPNESKVCNWYYPNLRDRICDCTDSYYGKTIIKGDIEDAVMIEKRHNTKQLGFNCWVWKKSKAELLEFLSQEKYKGYTENTVNIVEKLPDTEDYLLVAYDDD